MSPTLPLLVVLGLTVLPACKSAAQERSLEVERIAAEHERYMEEFRLAQSLFERENPMPQRLDYGPEGSLLLRECYLGGLPGREHLRVKFTYVNSTGTTIDSARVALTLTDPVSGTEWSEVMELEIPFGYGFSANSSYTGEFQMETHGLHRRPGWGWDIWTEAVHELPPEESE